MLTLFLLASTAFAAPERNACDGLRPAARLACVRQNYPRIHQTVEGICEGLTPPERKACRSREYPARGISWGDAAQDDEESVGAAAPAGARTGAKAQDSTRGQAPRSGLRGGQHRMRQLNPMAVTLTTIGLTGAGVLMQNTPVRCAKSGTCKMSPESQARVAAFGAVIAAQGPRIPAILGSRDPDAIKIDALLGVLDEVLTQAPTGMEPEAQALVDGAVTAARAIVPLLIEP